MRRHVENQIERPEKDGLGILILLVMWMLALMVLSAAARGQETILDLHGASDDAHQLRADGAQDGQNPSPAETTQQFRSAQSSQERKREGESPDKAQKQPESADQVTLTRFILISIPDRQLALIDGGQVVKIYPIAVGALHSPSPQGNFTIISHVANPTWSHKGKVVGPGKNNPVGSRWMGLSLKGYGIHGTNVPRSIGKAASHGCFRMAKRDIEELFRLVHVGDTVAVRGEKDELVSQVFGDGSHNGEVQVASVTVASADAAEDGENRSRAAN